MTRLKGKVALITGGASGIGEATGRLFVEEGAAVMVADIQDERGRRVAGELGSRAGYDATIGVLLRGVFLGIKHAAPVMKRQGAGSIISTASVAGLRTGLGPHIYSAAKAAVIHLTHSVAMELGESGVRVNCICPGGIATPIFGKSLGLSPERAEEIIPLMKGVLENLQPIKRPGLPEDIARAALWLASGESTFVNGHALVVDGGIIGGRPWSESQLRRETLKATLGLT